YKEQRESIRRFKEYPLLQEQNRRLSAENNELKRQVAELSSENSLLKETKVMTEEGKRTLPELKQVVIKLKGEEIDARALRVFEAYKSEWEQSKGRAWVVTQAGLWINNVLFQLQRPPNERVYSIGSKEPEFALKIETMMKKQIEPMVTAELQKRDPRAATLDSEIRKNVFKRLNSPWIVTCDKCGTKFPISLTAHGISDIYTQGYFWLECQNESCLDGARRHLFKLTLPDMVDSELKSSLDVARPAEGDQR
ncbi:MAG TPA: cell division protein ZapB, partial [Candidatus Bathyarchaeia archaeon]|nr:cell division protein ZapB [Candidatus Bathyarchaeia archaeon]